MADQKPFHETILPVIHFIPQNPDETILRTIFHFIRITNIPKNHESIIAALEKTLARLTDQERWEGDFRETIASVLAQKETAEKTVSYEGLLTRDDLRSFIPVSLNAFIYHGSPAKLSIEPCEEDSDLCHFTISSNSEGYLDNDFGPNGVLSTWSEKFTRISALPKSKTEKTNAVTLPSGDILSFENGHWWITRSRGGDKEECLRSEAHNLLRQNCLVNAITDEAWADIIKHDQPLL
ncbi:MAG: hypothetical protein UR60_C0003G0012 [Candidatus Moranbacteria bacterium GW2011_GWF2_34_56]|nr:MAG: hypothetical protein UR51_C0004G0003 [Candidatus Moranbacteria bacterium GW2011_GWF1_34_10]KKP65321.1 MAG: hypothetical protein UR60_C0003G0012 [Candidatus Moranbacteria bacterium GW2011_GWF2_34_56]HBI16566.1 hypothetical protein [Candidatus Moranbacteria bacterium]